MAKKAFSLATVLSVTTGRLMTQRRGPHDNGISDVYRLLEHMTRDSSSTHQLGRFASECTPWLYRWFPELREIESEVNVFCDGMQDIGDAGEREEKISGFLSGLAARLGCREYQIDQIPMNAHEFKDPIDELVIMRGTAEGIIPVTVSDPSAH